jgi:hypothetical protein
MAQSEKWITTIVNYCVTESKEWRALAICSAAWLYEMREVSQEVLHVFAPMASWLGMHRLENKLDMASATTPFLAVSDERHPLQYPLHVLQMSLVPYILDDSTHPYIHWRSGQECFSSCRHTRASIMKHPHQQRLDPATSTWNFLYRINKPGSFIFSQEGIK